MSQRHVTHCMEVLRIGTTDPILPLSTWKIPEDQVLAISDEWEFDDDHSYDVTAPPEGVTALGVTYLNGQAYIAGDSGDCMFIFRLSQPAA